MEMRNQIFFFVCTSNPLKSFADIFQYLNLIPLLITRTGSQRTFYNIYSIYVKVKLIWSNCLKAFHQKYTLRLQVYRSGTDWLYHLFQKEVLIQKWTHFKQSAKVCQIQNIIPNPTQIKSQQKRNKSWGENQQNLNCEVQGKTEKSRDLCSHDKLNEI